MPRISLIELINALAVLFLAAFIGWTKYRERKLSKDNELLDNPERCKDHANRLREIELKLSAWESA